VRAVLLVFGQGHELQRRARRDRKLPRDARLDSVTTRPIRAVVQERRYAIATSSCNRPRSERVLPEAGATALFSRGREPDDPNGDEGVAGALSGGRALGRECDRYGRRLHMRELDEEEKDAAFRPGLPIVLAKPELEVVVRSGLQALVLLRGTRPRPVVAASSLAVVAGAIPCGYERRPAARTARSTKSRVRAESLEHG
jgi:hypothetical protein